MNVQMIEELWKPSSGGPRSGVEWWNGRAEYFSEMQLPNVENSLGMHIIQNENMVGKGSRTLDVGCGGGRFSFALEIMGAEATATDFSPEMIRKARELAEKRGSKVRFSVDDWHEVDLQKKGWERSFDLVLANMTPAVASAETFMKLIEASRNWVLMVKPTRRTDPVLDELLRLIGAERETKASDDESLAYAFHLAWMSGACPRFEYEDQLWKNDTALEKAVEDYSLQISSFHKLTDKDRIKIHEYLKQIAENGIVHETTRTTIAAMYWQV